MSASPDGIEWLSVRAFARRDGCDEKLVRTALRNGKLRKSDAGLLPAFLVGTGWRAGNRGAADMRWKLAAEGAALASAVTEVSAPTGPTDNGLREAGYVDALHDLARAVPAIVTDAAVTAGLSAATLEALVSAIRPRVLSRMAALLDAEAVSPDALGDDHREPTSWAGYEWPADFWAVDDV